MHLPGRLRMSTLGDLLGTLHRARISGVLALRELSGTSAGRRHLIHLRGGFIVSVGLASEEAADRPVAPMTRAQVQQRLEALYHLDDAELTFHVARGALAPPLEQPLTPAEFLHGRPRSRDRTPRGSLREDAASVLSALRHRALETLGLPPNAEMTRVRQAFRTLALQLHPDRHPHADETERSRLAQEFARLTQAYRVLNA